jgi:hypothetical protein
MSTRRAFLRKAALGAAGLSLASALPHRLLANKPASGKDIRTARQAASLQDIPNVSQDLFFKIAVSQFSFASQFWTKQLDPLDFACQIEGTGHTRPRLLLHVFCRQGKETGFSGELKKRCADAGSYNLRIMIDAEGVLGDLNEANRLKAVDNHYKWIDAAATLGCPMIRVNVEGEGQPADVANAAVDSLGRLITYGSKAQIDVIVENHVGISCNGAWLAGVMKQLNSPHGGTLADLAISVSTAQSRRPWT